MKVKISTTVPLENADEMRDVLGNAGAGIFGEYKYCSFSITGKGRFLPTSGAHPHIGRVGELETVEEEKIEVICDRKDAKGVIKALKFAHPYEEAIVEITPLLDEAEV